LLANFPLDVFLVVVLLVFLDSFILVFSFRGSSSIVN
jgi:hypothetical protein